MPMCNYCGTTIENFGICAECVEKRQARLNNEERKSKSPPNSFLKLLIPQLIPICFGVLTLSVILFASIGFSKEVANFKTDGSFYVVSNEDNSTQLTYRTEEFTSIEGYIHEAVGQTGSVNEGGVVLQLHYLNSGAYQEFQKKYGNVKSCPASFYNSNMLHTFVLSSSKDCAKKISNKSYKQWERFMLSGKLLTFVEGTSNGNRVGMPSGDFNYLLVESCS